MASKKSSSSNKKVAKRIVKATTKAIKKNKNISIPIIVSLFLVLVISLIVLHSLKIIDLSNFLTFFKSNETTTVVTSQPTTTFNHTGDGDYNDGILEPYSSNIELCDDGYVENVIYENFQIHFMENGSHKTGDSTYIKAGDIDILIDAGSTQGSATTLESYINNFCTDGILEYVIVTHAHRDHWAGMFGNSKSNQKDFFNETVGYTGILYYYRVGTLIDFSLTNETEENKANSNTEYYKYTKAVEYAVSNGTINYKAHECFDNINGASSHYVLSEEYDISFDIVYNYYYYNNSSIENNYSVCTMFNYGDYHFLLTGDLEKEGEEKMAEYYDGSTPFKTLPHVELFKAGHHGSQTSSNNCLLEKITPSICCVCCCAGSTEFTPNLVNIFPTQAFIDRIKNYTDRVYVTTLLDEDLTRSTNEWVFKSLNGNICVSSNGNYIGLYGSNNLIKLKDTEWFNEEVYVISTSSGYNVAPSKSSKAYYDSLTAGAILRPRRTWIIE